MSNLITTITKALHEHAEPEYKAGVTRFFKESVNPIGVRVPIVRTLGKKYYPKELQKKEIFSLCETLLEKRTLEHTILAFAWARNQEKDLVPSDFARLSRWIKTYVTNWAFCDDICTHTFGSLIYQYPTLLPKIFVWTTSRNRWLRRAAAVTLIHSIKKREKNILPHVYATTEALLHDRDDLVQKGYGWMLKEASNIWPADVYAFVLKHKDVMPRTALRYAVEKYPKEMKQHAMTK